MAIYFHSVFLIAFGAVLNEAGVGVTSLYFWLLVVIVFGILLTYDMIRGFHEDPPPDEKDKE